MNNIIRLACKMSKLHEYTNKSMINSNANTFRAARMSDSDMEQEIDRDG